jgi:hypothetical protein
MHRGRAAWHRPLLIALAVLVVAWLTAAPAGASTAVAANGTGDALGQVGQAVTQVTPPAPPEDFAETPPAPVVAANQASACPVASSPGDLECMAIAQTGLPSLTGVQADASTIAGYTPANLQNAYGLTSASASGGTSGGLPQTVAVVDAYYDQDAAADLATYRAQWGLPACASGNGIGTTAGCIEQVNEDNQLITASSHPPAPPDTADWTFETSADLDMVSATCPNCRILLFEANSTSITDMGEAELSAENDANFIANSWGSPEFFGESSYDTLYFNNTANLGKAIVFAAGNSGYGTSWPAASPFVTAAGGTTLTAASGTTRGWTETAWSDSGSGCTVDEPKPSWQTADDTSPDGCLNRTDNDVAAVADPATGVAVYDSTGFGSRTAGWGVAGGTSVSASIITSVYALAGSPTSGTYPVSYLYQSGHASDLYPVTSGSDGTCESNRAYLCTAQAGYNGPAGLGTPDGTAAFADSAAGDEVSIPDPGTQDYQTGAAVSVPMDAADSASGATVTYTATGLPAGVTISSATGLISGTLTSTAGTSTVKVTAEDNTGASGSVTFDIVVVPSLAADWHLSSGSVDLNDDGLCMDDTNGTLANGNKIQVWSCSGGYNQVWAFNPDGSPGGAGTMTFHGMCLAASGNGTTTGTKLELWTCQAGGTGQQWALAGEGELYNPLSGLCATDPGGSTTNGTQLALETCADAAYQQWVTPSSPIQSGVTGMCVDNSAGDDTNGNKIQIYGCLGNTNQKWFYHVGDTLQTGGLCMGVVGASNLDGALIELLTCTGGASQKWVPGPQGQVENAGSGRCLDDPGNTTTDGTQLVQEDCYGVPGEVWAVT